MIQTNGYPGLYIVFEGMIGNGKSTQLGLLEDYLKKQGIDAITTREPGGTPMAEMLRNLVKSTDPAVKTQNPLTESYLFAAARRDLADRVIVPELLRGSMVVSDRSFVSSCAYQGMGRGLGVRRVIEINKGAYIVPDCVVFIQPDIETAIQRSSQEDADKFDSETHAFWARVSRGYHEMFTIHLAREGVQILHIDDREGKKTIEEIQTEIRAGLDPLIREWNINREGEIVRERQV